MMYTTEKKLKDKILPEYLQTSSCYTQVWGHNPAKQWVNISRNRFNKRRWSRTQFRILEDNVRTPSGVSYLLQIIEILKHTFPALFESLNVVQYPIIPFIKGYARISFGCLSDTIAVLTPRAFIIQPIFEHAF